MRRSPRFPGHVQLPTDRTLIMGILNVTPDSFSDGGRFLRVEDAVRHADKLVEQGADIVDVGGESTRPGSRRLSSQEELERIEPVVAALVAGGHVVSVDTVHAHTARVVCDLGAVMINDVSGAQADPLMAAAMAQSSAVVVIQHWRGFPGSDNERLLDDEAVPTVIADLHRQIEVVRNAGVADERIAIDPGLGFAKTVDASWDTLAALPTLMEQLPYPVVVGASRKRFVNAIVATPEAVESATAAISALSAFHGAWAVRVHAPQGNAAAIAAARQWVRGTMRLNNGQ
ncbi:MAG: dihydropteroate synthase [Actinomycetaceae bacterium]|nr:dihydropteroate synthase [Actinomycetaceae bacterium]